MSDINERLREKTLQIAALNQKIETLHAQLAASRRRANELTVRVETLEQQVAEKEQETQALRAEVRRYKDALDRLGKEVQSMRAGQSAAPRVRTPGATDDLRGQVEESQRLLGSLQGRLSRLQDASLAVVTGEEGAVDRLRQTLMEVGDLEHKVFLLLFQKRRARLEEIAAALVADVQEVASAVDGLVDAGELEFKDAQTVVLGRKYTEVEVPTAAWQTASPAEIFDSLVDIIGRTDEPAVVARALEEAADALEQQLSRGGALMFEMRRTASSWRSAGGDTESLKYKVREWKMRALSSS